MIFFQKHKNDLLLILSLLVLSGGVWLGILWTRSAGGEAVVTVDGEVKAVLPLAKDTVYSLEASALGLDDSGVGNMVRVLDGAVCVAEANCPDQVCVRTGWIRYEGEMIVCLPHKLVITVRGGESSDVDVLVQ